ncbi:MAG TPA: class I SAM-dependent methyltransferase, partial [Bacteroidales bacterium]|nr:class I SAM-dependent methyltransferase [Bacteroidales bacterium]
MGEKFYNDDYYFQSALVEGDRFVNKLQVNQNSEILEIGCSSGRSVIGLIERAGRVKRYVGLDAKRANISWCNKYIATRSNFCSFQYINLYSILYNPTGTIRVDENFRLNFESESFDIVYVQSVLPNYFDGEIRILAREFHRLLKPDGTLFLTSFVEENVPPVTENPENYIMVCTYPRQIIRFEKNFFIE